MFFISEVRRARGSLVLAGEHRIHAGLKVELTDGRLNDADAIDQKTRWIVRYVKIGDSRIVESVDQHLWPR